MGRTFAGGPGRCRNRETLRTIVLVLVAAVPVAVSALSVASTPVRASSSSGVTLDASNTSVTLSFSGMTPGAVGLSWTPATDLLFSHYEVYQSSTSSAGPWIDLGSITSQSSTTYFAGGLAPAGAYWWRVTVTDSLAGTSSSNVAHGTTPAAPTVAAVQTSGTTVNVTWTNPGVYSTVVAFGSYSVLTVGAGGATNLIAMTNSPSVQEYTVESVQNNTTYTFEVQTTDVCGSAANCGATAQPATTMSRTGSVSTAATLRTSVNAHHTTVAVGANDTFACSAQGGKHPYAFAWTFGDGTTATGPFATHTYATSGTYVVACTVSDAFHSVASSTNSVTVTGPSTSGGGGSGGTPPGGGGNPPGGGGSGGSAGRSVPLGTLLGPVAAAVLVAAFVIAVLVLAMLSRRRRKDSHPPTGAGVVLNGDIPPAQAPGDVGEAPLPPFPTAAAPPTDLDRLMDELENASTDSG